MQRTNHYRYEITLIVTVMVVSVLGFWDIYIGAGSKAAPHHHLHLATAFAWLFLLLMQVILLGGGNRQTHRKLGLSVLFAAPLLVATTAMLSVRSAHEGVVSGEGDFLIIQNVGVTVELAVLILLAFLLKKKRKLHGALLASTSLLFLGIALFFALLSFVPMFRIEGPETFYRFQTAAMTGQAICLGAGLLMFLKDWRNGWPYLAAPAAFLLNEAIRASLSSAGLIDPLTELVGSMSQPLTFFMTFAMMAGLLAATALPASRQPRIA